MDEALAREACLAWWREYMSDPAGVNLGGGMIIDAFIAGARWSAGHGLAGELIQGLP